VKFERPGTVSTVVNCQIINKTYGTLFYNQKPDLATANPVTVTVPNVTKSIDAILPLTSSTTGFRIYLPLIRRS